MRAQNFGDLVFVDHVNISIISERENDQQLIETYVVLVIVDAASNLI